MLNDFNINEIGKTSRFCSRKRIIKPFELVMSLITALGDKSVSTGTEVTLSDFKRIVLQDGSSFAVHDSLKETFKGRFTKVSSAAIEVHVSWDVLKGYPEENSVSPDNQAEYDFLPDAKSLVDTLFLADRGYFKLSYLRSIDTADGFYIVRAKTTVNPVVVADFNRCGKTNYRLIASWPKGKSDPTYWATNLSR